MTITPEPVVVEFDLGSERWRLVTREGYSSTVEVDRGPDAVGGSVWTESTQVDWDGHIGCLAAVLGCVVYAERERLPSGDAPQDPEQTIRAMVSEHGRTQVEEWARGVHPPRDALRLDNGDYVSLHKDIAAELNAGTIDLGEALRRQASRPPGGAEPGLREAMEALASDFEGHGRTEDATASWAALRMCEVLEASEGAAPPQPDEPSNSGLTEDDIVAAIDAVYEILDSPYVGAELANDITEHLDSIRNATASIRPLMGAPADDHARGSELAAASSIALVNAVPVQDHRDVLARVQELEAQVQVDHARAIVDLAELRVGVLAFADRMVTSYPSSADIIDKLRSLVGEPNPSRVQPDVVDSD